LHYNPDIELSDIPSDIVTASGSGLDPHISVQAAMIQVPRISKIRKISPDILKKTIKDLTEKPMFGIFGTEKIHVLTLNLALDSISHF
jgi:K+-transporting ATPase ATPase C chain